jgi:prepilin-type processing-associated H-X9-DG protein
VQQAREAARRTECRNKLKQHGLALHNYHDVFKLFPFGAVESDTGMPQMQMNWRFDILPYIDQAPLYNVLAQLPRWGNCVPGGADGSAALWLNRPEQLQVIPLFICPSESVGPILGGNQNGHDTCCPSTSAMASYQGNASTLTPYNSGGWGYFGDNPSALEPPGMMSHYPTRISVAKVTDGTSNTFFVGERTAKKEVSYCGGADEGTNYTCWMGQFGAVGTINYGINYRCRSSWITGLGFSSMHSGGAHFLMVDGAVRFVSENTAQSVLTALSTRKSGDVVGEF